MGLPPPPRRLPAVLLGAAALGLAAATLAGSPADLEGEWVLDAERSDDPLAVMQEALDTRRLRVQRLEEEPGRGLSVGGTGVGGGFPSGRDGTARAFDPETIVAHMEDAARGIERLSVRHEHPMMSVRRADGTVRTLRVDGKRTVSETVDGQVSVRARWKSRHDRLDVSTVTDWGQDTATTWRVLPGTGELEVHTVLRPVAGLPKIEFRLRYDRADPESEDDEGR